MLRPLPPLPQTNEKAQKEVQEKGMKTAPLKEHPVFNSYSRLRHEAVRNGISGPSGVKAEWIPRKLSELPAEKESAAWI